MKIKNNMKNIINKSGLFLMVLIVSGCSTSEEQTVARFTTISMQDEFNQDGVPNSSIWTYDIGRGQDGWGNSELQYYTDRPSNVTVQNGYLIITAEEENYEGASYTSARLLTKGLFDQKYGRFEARMRLPYGQGMWPAFWMLGSNIDEVSWPQCGEIDIMENRGSEPTIMYGAVHGPGYCGSSAICAEPPVFKGFDLQNERLDTNFHVYGIEWGPGYINFYIDDVLYNQVTPEDVNGEWVFDDESFFIIINLAVGGNFGGPPNAETVFPQTLLVDYVRVYESY